MQKYEMNLSLILPEDADKYIATVKDLSNAASGIMSLADQLLRTGDEDHLLQIKRLMTHVETFASRARRMIENKKVHDKAFASGHAVGYDTGRVLGYEEGVREAQQAQPQLTALLGQIASSGAGLTLINIERGAQRDFPNR